MAPPTTTTEAEESVGALPRKSLLILIWVCFSAAFSLVTLRTVIRLRSPTSRRLLPLEDCWILLALTSLLALCILETIQLPSLYYITGVLSGVIPITSAEVIISQTENYLRFQFPIVILFWTVLWSVKAAFLALYWRLFRDLPWYRRAWFALAVFTFLAYGGCVTTLALSCGPDVRNFFAFNKCAGPQNVWSSNFSVYFSTAVDVFTDVCIMAMPLRLIYNVKVSLKQKIGLVGVFSLGFVMIVFSIIRANQTLVSTGFVNLTLLMIWSSLAASICKSTPAYSIGQRKNQKPKSNHSSLHHHSRPRGHPPGPQSPHHDPRPRVREPIRQRRLARHHPAAQDVEFWHSHQEHQERPQCRRSRLAPPRQQQPQIGIHLGCERVTGGDPSAAGCGQSPHINIPSIIFGWWNGN